MPLVLYNEINVFYGLCRVSACWKLLLPCKQLLARAASRHWRNPQRLLS